MWIDVYRYRHRGKFSKNNIFFLIQRTRRSSPIYHIYGKNVADKLVEHMDELIGEENVVMAMGEITPTIFNFTRIDWNDAYRHSRRMRYTFIAQYSSLLAKEATACPNYSLEDFWNSDIQDAGKPIGLLLRSLAPRSVGPTH